MLETAAAAAVAWLLVVVVVVVVVVAVHRSKLLLAMAAGVLCYSRLWSWRKRLAFCPCFVLFHWLTLRLNGVKSISVPLLSFFIYTYVVYCRFSFSFTRCVQYLSIGPQWRRWGYDFYTVRASRSSISLRLWPVERSSSFFSFSRPTPEPFPSHVLTLRFGISSLLGSAWLGQLILLFEC